MLSNVVGARGLQPRAGQGRARHRRARLGALDHAARAVRGPGLPACDADLLCGAGRHAGARPDDRADPVGGAVLRARSARGQARPRSQPELPRPAPAAPGAHRLPDRSAVSEGRRPRRRRPGRRRALGLRPARRGGSWRRARPQRQGRPLQRRGRARGRPARVQHAARALPRRAPAPGGQLRARQARARRHLRGGGERPLRPARRARREPERRSIRCRVRTWSGRGRSPAAALCAPRACTSAAIPANLRIAEDRTREPAPDRHPCGDRAVTRMPVGSRPEG